MSATWTMPRDMSKYSSLEAALLAQLHAAELPEPVAEFPFARCCPHPKKTHRRSIPSKEIATTGHICLDCYETRSRSAAHEYRKGRAWRFDFAWPALMLAVECEGGTWSGGRHTRGDGYAKDTDKYNAASLAGWAVLRFTGDRIESGAALEIIEQALRQRMEAAL